MNVFDFDGVITIGLLPQVGDVVITGRGYDECHIVYRELQKKLPTIWYQIPVFFNSRTKSNGRTREDSGNHKLRTIYNLIRDDNKIDIVFEDDPIQFEILKKGIAEWSDQKFVENRPKICFVDSHWTHK